MLSKNSADALLEEKVSIIFLSNRNSFELSLWILSLTLSDEPILENTELFASDPRSDDRAELLGGAVHQPGIPLRADAEQHHHQNGQHPLPHRQRLLSRLQVGTELKDLIILSFFRSMYRNVVSAMKEAQDITTHLKPLASHFEVDGFLKPILEML